MWHSTAPSRLADRQRRARAHAFQPTSQHVRLLPALRCAIEAEMHTTPGPSQKNVSRFADEGRR